MFDQEPQLPPRTSDPADERPRTLEEAKAWMLDRAAKKIHPMNNLSVKDTAGVVTGLQGLDPVNWAAAWRKAGEAAFAEAEAQTHPASRREGFLKAHGFFFMGRFPCPNHPHKLISAERERDAYLAAAALFDPPTERIVVPFAGRDGEGQETVFLYRRPAGVERPPVIMMWGGVDAWKEQMTTASDLVLAQGVATIAIDGPGTGESPVKGVPDAERQFLPAMDWAAEQSDLDGSRIGLLGRSFGGYWATKLAHVVPDRIAGAVNWGGGAHFMFQREWIERSRHPDSYLMELVETRMRMLGVDSEEGYIEAFSKLSLIDQGLLDKTSAPMLLVNGRGDSQCPVADIDLLTGHGLPKAVRMFPGGHMGITPQTLPLIADWLCAKVKQESRA